LVLGHSIEAANLSTFLKFGNAKKKDICVIFAKENHGWPRNWLGVEQNWGLVPSRLGPKAGTAIWTD